MTLSNLGFETAGGSPGAASAWTTSVTATAEQVAAWGAGSPKLDEDGFEVEWGNDSYLMAFGLSDTSPSLLDTDVSEGETIEDFEEGWSGNEGYLFEDASAAVAMFDSALTPQDVEDFSDGWDSGPTAGNAYDFTLGATTAASFDASISPQGFEDFEDGWRGTGAGNDYLTSLSSSTAAVFDGAAPESVEDFEEVVYEKEIVVVPASDFVTTATNHDLSVGVRVTFRMRGAGVLPGGLSEGFPYWVLGTGITATAFKVSATSGGAVLDITDLGVGAAYEAGDRTVYWVVPAF